MRILNRFRKKQEDVLPEEVEKYYQSQRKARIGTAWLLGFATLIITLIVTLALFYGARYAYRQITGSNDTAKVTPAGENKPDSIPNGNTQPTKKNKREAESGTQVNGSGQNQESSGISPRTGDTLPSNGDQPLPATGDPGL